MWSCAVGIYSTKNLTTFKEFVTFPAASMLSLGGRGSRFNTSYLTTQGMYVHIEQIFVDSKKLMFAGVQSLCSISELLKTIKTIKKKLFKNHRLG